MGKIYGCGTNYKKYWGGLLTTKVTSVRRPAYQSGVHILSLIHI